MSEYPRDEDKEENIHILLETNRILLIYGKDIFEDEIHPKILKYVSLKIKNNRNDVVQKSLINIIPVMATSNKEKIYLSNTFFEFMSFLKSITGEDRVLALTSILSLINEIPEGVESPEILKELKDTSISILQNLKERVEKQNFVDKRGMVMVKILHSITLKFKKDKMEALFARS